MLSTTVYRGRLFSLGEFHCPPGSERWRQINVVEEPALVAFPGTSVVIEHLGRPPLLANQNHVMFYNHEQRYRRALHDGRGDHCVFVAVELSLLAELLAAAGLELEEPALPFTNGPSDARSHLLLHLAIRELRRKPERSPNGRVDTRSPRQGGRAGDAFQPAAHPRAASPDGTTASRSRRGRQGSS